MTRKRGPEVKNTPTS